VEIALVAAAVDMMLKDSIEAGRKILGLGGEVKRMGMSWRVKKEIITPTRAILVEFFHLNDMNVECSMGKDQASLASRDGWAAKV
jgi:hypothetical protein